MTEGAPDPLRGFSSWYRQRAQLLEDERERELRAKVDAIDAKQDVTNDRLIKLETRVNLLFGLLAALVTIAQVAGPLIIKVIGLP